MRQIASDFASDTFTTDNTLNETIESGYDGSLATTEVASAYSSTSPWTVSPATVPVTVFTPAGTDLDDHFSANASAEHFDGGAGLDTVSYGYAATGVSADLLYGGTYGDADGDTYTSIENLFGSGHSDTLLGNDANNHINGYNGDDFIYGRDGDDRLFGGEGNDVLRGDDGNDNLFGEEGNDLLAGGEGADTFHFNMFGNGSDFVLDFQHGIDSIDMHYRSSPHWPPSSGGLLGHDFALAHGSIIPVLGGILVHEDLDSSDSLFFNDQTHQLIALDRTQSNLLDQVTHGQVIATFTGDVNLTAADFI